jgi:hypothetical protein
VRIADVSELLISLQTGYHWHKTVVKACNDLDLFFCNLGMASLRCASAPWQSDAVSSFGDDVYEMGIILKFTLNISKGKE